MIIYKCTNFINGKAYIGQTISTIEKRWKGHCKCKRKCHFSSAIRKYGTQCWKLEIIEEVSSRELLNDREIYWIAYYDTFKNGYNSTSGGKQAYQYSLTVCKKISAARIGMKFDHNHIISMKFAQCGQYNGKKNPFFGKKHSLETLKRGVETRRSNGNSLKGSRWFTNGIVNKMCSIDKAIPEGFYRGRISTQNKENANFVAGKK